MPGTFLAHLESKIALLQGCFVGQNTSAKCLAPLAMAQMALVAQRARPGARGAHRAEAAHRLAKSGSLSILYTSLIRTTLLVVGQPFTPSPCQGEGWGEGEDCGWCTG